jgi:integrase/recombinase XerD
MNRPSHRGCECRGRWTLIRGSFSQELSRLGYSSSRAAGHLQLMAHLSRWLADIGWDPGELTVAWAERFVEHRRASGRVHRCLTLRGMGPLLDHLREIGVVPEPEPSRRWVGASS